eukprot:jgi/Botrbrau1/8460/Bobra.0237s0077.1
MRVSSTTTCLQQMHVHVLANSVNRLSCRSLSAGGVRRDRSRGSAKGINQYRRERRACICTAGLVGILLRTHFFETPPWTLDQIAGLVFGGVMAASYFGAGVVDMWVGRGQREELGICQLCSGLNDETSCAEAKCPRRNPNL